MDCQITRYTKEMRKAAKQKAMERPDPVDVLNATLKYCKEQKLPGFDKIPYAVKETK